MHLMLAVQFCRHIVHSVPCLICGIIEIIEVSKITVKSALCRCVAIGEITHCCAVPIADDKLGGFVDACQRLYISFIISGEAPCRHRYGLSYQRSSSDLCVISFFVVIQLYCTGSGICSKIRSRRRQLHRLGKLFVSICIGNAVFRNCICPAR